MSTSLYARLPDTPETTFSRDTTQKISQVDRPLQLSSAYLNPSQLRFDVCAHESASKGSSVLQLLVCILSVKAQEPQVCVERLVAMHKDALITTSDGFEFLEAACSHV